MVSCGQVTSEEDTNPPAVSWEELAVHVQDELLPDGAPPIRETTPLISSGLLDSYSVVELIAYVEERFNVKVAPRWHRLEHFDTLERIVETVERIQGQHCSKGT